MVHKLGCPQLLDNLEQVDFIVQLFLASLVKLLFYSSFRETATTTATAEPLQAVKRTVVKVFALFQVVNKNLPA
jgi:hypothetical protein